MGYSSPTDFLCGSECCHETGVVVVIDSPGLPCLPIGSDIWARRHSCSLVTRYECVCPHSQRKKLIISNRIYLNVCFRGAVEHDVVEKSGLEYVIVLEGLRSEFAQNSLGYRLTWCEGID
jgi:hypothetical protein